MYSSLVKKILLLSIFTLPFSLFAQDSGGIEEVVVTAEKREQNLQDVPSSITAISDTEIERGTYQNIFDLQTSVPSSWFCWRFKTFLFYKRCWKS